jgi:hypothetical protein
MSVLLVHDGKGDDGIGHVAISEGMVAGEYFPARHYHHRGKFLHVDGHPHVIANDVAEMQKMGYRLATADEQQQSTSESKKSKAIREGTR